MNDFDFVQTKSSEDALLKMSSSADALAVAGGTNVLVNMKRAPLQADLIVDISQVAEYRSIGESEDTISLGAGVTFSEILEWAPGGAIEALLRPMAALFAGPLIRNLATIGGNICDASPAADVSPPLLALDARVHLESPGNKNRDMPLEDFFEGPRQTNLKPGELMAQIDIPSPAADCKTFYYKLGKRRADAISIVSIAILVRLRDNVVEHARIALGAASPVALCAKAAQTELIGKSLTPERIKLAAEIASNEACPIDDFRASATYRKNMVGVLVARGLTEIATTN